MNLILKDYTHLLDLFWVCVNYTAACDSSNAAMSCHISCNSNNNITVAAHRGNIWFMHVPQWIPSGGMYETIRPHYPSTVDAPVIVGPLHEPELWK